MVSSNYNIEKISNNIWSIEDDFRCTVYIVNGKNKSIVIDTGMATSNNLKSMIEEIATHDPLVLLTHLHFDHVGHLKEFNEFFVSKDEVIFDEAKDYIDLNKAIYYEDGNYTFDLGDRIIKVLVLPGHTKGSCLIIDEKEKAIFTGDQFGSGCGVWMHVLDSVCISKYIESIGSFLNYLTNNYSFPINEWKLYGGHRSQEYTSSLCEYNPLNIEMVQNFKILSEKLLKGEIELHEKDTKVFNNETPYYVSYGNAEMVIRKSLIR